MNVLCLEKSNKPDKIKELINFVNKQQNKIIIYPDLSKMKFKNKIKIVKKIKKIIFKEKVDKIIPSILIKQDREFMNLLYSSGINTTNDRLLFKILTDKVVDKLIVSSNRSKKEIWITVNDMDNIVKNIILKFAREFKRVNIITNHINRFRKIEEILYEEGIVITITNNRKKSLLKAELILNIDFPKEVLNQFAIFDKSTIINLEGNMSIKKKRYCGRIINDIKIQSYQDVYIEDFIKMNHMEDYDIKDIYDILNKIPANLDFKLI